MQHVNRPIKEIHLHYLCSCLKILHQYYIWILQITEMWCLRNYGCNGILTQTSHVILEYNSIIRDRCGVTIRYFMVHGWLYLVAMKALNEMSVVVIDG